MADVIEVLVDRCQGRIAEPTALRIVITHDAEIIRGIEADLVHRGHEPEGVFVVVANDGEITLVNFPAFRELIHRLRTGTDQAAEVRHILPGGVVDVTADFALQDEIVRRFRTNEGDASVTEKLVVAAGVLDRGRGTGGTENLALLEAILLQPGNDQRQADGEGTIGDELAYLFHAIVREPRQRDSDALLFLQAADLRQDFVAEAAHPDGAEIDMLPNAGMGDGLQDPVGVGVAILVNENPDAVVLRPRRHANLVRMPCDEGATAHAAHDGAVIDQTLERLANGEEIALVRNGQVSLGRQLGPQGKGLGQLPDFGFDALIFKLGGRKIHKTCKG